MELSGSKSRIGLNKSGKAFDHLYEPGGRWGVARENRHPCSGDACRPMIGRPLARLLLGSFPFLILGALFIFWPEGPPDVEAMASKSPAATRAGTGARNIILFIGDGLGVNHLALARFQKGHLVLEEMEHTGFSFTYSLRNFVPDSASSATALATGYRAVNAQISVFPDGRPIKTVLEYAEDLGKWTGLVATSRVTHATPACMASHVKDRNDEDEIASQLAKAGVEVILGGGWDRFAPPRRKQVKAPGPVWQVERRGGILAASIPGEFREVLTADGAARSGGVRVDGSPYGTRSDGRDIIREMKERGYQFVRTSTELLHATRQAPDKLLGLFTAAAMSRVTEGRDPSLSAMTLAALRILSRSPEGFFLMVEGSQIDWGSHQGDHVYAMSEAVDFDDSIGAALGFLESEGLASETLVVVTADHETGGLTLGSHPKLPLGIDARWMTTEHTGAPVPVFSSGPDSEKFGGITDHAMIGRHLIESLLGRKLIFDYPRDEQRPAAPKKTRL